MVDLKPAAGPALAAFLASSVEFVEALTVVLAIGGVRGWRDALVGAAAAVGSLAVLAAVLGPALTLIPLRALQVALGGLLLLFGLRWLRKAILRVAGVLALHDEAAAYAKQREAMLSAGQRRAGFDAVAFGGAFHICMIEGVEVLFVVIAVGAGGRGLLVPASLGAAAALAMVAALGFALRKPIARAPENQLKLIVGVLLSAFGSFWMGEGLGLPWPGQDASILGLIAGFALTALAAAPLCRARRQRAAGAPA
jgi:Ca2+/H+ antiporter, TMEM165/GDT1 family